MRLRQARLYEQRVEKIYALMEYTMDICNELKKYKQVFMPKDAVKENMRIEYIDLLKAIAAFLTVFYHYGYYKLDYGFDITQGSYLPNINRIIMCFASCCVPVFFMVNGALLLKKRRSWKSVYRKAVKIFILTAVWSLVGFPSWFFKTLFALYIMFPAFQYLYEKHMRLYWLIIFILLIFPFGYNAVILLMKLLSESKTINAFGSIIEIEQFSVTGFFTMYSIVYFLLGPILAKTRIPTICGVISLLVGWGMVIFECVSYTVINETVYDGVNAAFPTYGALMLSVGIFIIAKNKVRTGNKITGLMRDQILAIYLLHMGVIHVIGRITGVTVLNLPMAIVGTVLILLVCVGVGKIAGRIPGLCWLFRI